MAGPMNWCLPGRSSPKGCPQHRAERHPWQSSRTHSSVLGSTRKSEPLSYHSYWDCPRDLLYYVSIHPAHLSPPLPTALGSLSLWGQYWKQHSLGSRPGQNGAGEVFRAPVLPASVISAQRWKQALLSYLLLSSILSSPFYPEKHSPEQGPLPCCHCRKKAHRWVSRPPAVQVLQPCLGQRDGQWRAASPSPVLAWPLHTGKHVLLACPALPAGTTSCCFTAQPGLPGRSPQI